MFVSITDKQDSRVTMAEQTRKEAGLRDSIILHFGKFHKRLSIVIDNSVQPGEILVPARLSRRFTIPDLPYELKFRGSALHLGPVIGFMNYKSIYVEPELALARFARYSEIKGLILIFRKRQVDTRQKLIQGKYYDPRTNSFIETVIPYPSAIYLRAKLPRRLYRQLRDALGARNIYDYPYWSNKWMFWDLVSPNPKVRPHLPETRKFGSVLDVQEMLGKYRSVYLKPVNWSRGRGIYRLYQEEHFTMEDSYGKSWTARTPHALIKLFKDLAPDREYLVQQDIPFYCQGQKVDFRIYLMKDRAKRWQYLWLETKVADKGSIISNWRNQDALMPGEEGLRKYYGLDDEGIRNILAEMTNICIHALNSMERGGHSLGDMAFDLVLDQDLKVWLLEAQTDYSADISIRDYMLEIIHPASFDYAKTLAGF